MPGREANIPQTLQRTKLFVSDIQDNPVTNMKKKSPLKDCLMMEKLLNNGNKEKHVSRIVISKDGINVACELCLG